MDSINFMLSYTKKKKSNLKSPVPFWYPFYFNSPLSSISKPSTLLNDSNHPKSLLWSLQSLHRLLHISPQPLLKNFSRKVVWVFFPQSTPTPPTHTHTPIHSSTHPNMAFSSSSSHHCQWYQYRWACFYFHLMKSLNITPHIWRPPSAWSTELVFERPCLLNFPSMSPLVFALSPPLALSVLEVLRVQSWVPFSCLSLLCI